MELVNEWTQTHVRATNELKWRERERDERERERDLEFGNESTNKHGDVKLVRATNHYSVFVTLCVRHLRCLPGVSPHICVYVSDMCKIGCKVCNVCVYVYVYVCMCVCVCVCVCVCLCVSVCVCVYVYPSLYPVLKRISISMANNTSEGGSN